MPHYLIEIFWSDEDDGYIATVPDLPGCSAWGKTQTEAAREIEPAMTAWIDACRKSGDPIPNPSTQARQAA
ncbi:type II toxin-antitoxin system HicB family antitoxin [Thiorhodovibrio frisius]|uniref:HicB-like antitoxin of toxin-antitoxin system domain-containing protein n=1 Tax=Thiorhodovibrio frisius TaxID=631362 RepID=H8Z7S4_9GAMM|nr:type II toxin-antitoxin system HicB family antitoxin [Thiorhodovibrio frisius]EIC19927.1 hypothetical protein Thi970DRAFT_03534 [Thiorhodovibrio frisius]WPL20656.1 hypothetical protein Thiofri_00755 [Thiorhodovibrio frisius]